MHLKQQTKDLESLSFSIAHEIKSPLSAIKNCCQIIHNNMRENLELIELMSSVSSRGLLLSRYYLTKCK